MTHSISWRSPANIALIKYWGKKGRQVPANPSLSFTLQNSFTETELRFTEKKSKSKQVDLAFFFEGKPKPDFEQKIKKYFSDILTELPFLTKYQFEIHSKNSFPHSAGIASSASGMSALALCLCSMEEQVKGGFKNSTTNTLSIGEGKGEAVKRAIFETARYNDFFRRASHLARLGSGSAARSVYGGVVTWGKIKGKKESSDKYASPFTGKADGIFHDFHDDILIVSADKKDVSSRAGHDLMNSHPFAKSRFKQAGENLANLSKALARADLELFCNIVENEALTLHALMFSSSPPVMLLHPATLEIIKRVRAFRAKTGLPVCFTIDAGPNIHLLYPDSAAVDIGHLIQKELVVYCAHNRVISDRVGKGPEKLNA